MGLSVISASGAFESAITESLAGQPRDDPLMVGLSGGLHGTMVCAVNFLVPMTSSPLQWGNSMRARIGSQHGSRHEPMVAPAMQRLGNDKQISMCLEVDWA